MAVRALQRVSELEFSGPPSLDQLSQLPTCASDDVPVKSWGVVQRFDVILLR